MSVRISPDKGKGIDLNVTIPTDRGAQGFSTRDADLDVSIGVFGAWLTFTRGESSVSVFLSDAQRLALIETLSLVPGSGERGQCVEYSK